MKHEFTAETRALHHRVSHQDVFPSATPIYQNSAFAAESPYFYTRKANPNSVELEQALAILESVAEVVSTTTGMSALSLVLQFLKPGDHLVINRLIYGCSFKLIQRFCKHWGIKLSILDLTSNVTRDIFQKDVSMVIFETPTNPFLKTVEIKKISHAVKAVNPKALVVVDNTWATPLFQHPLSCGADISFASATKFISGHSDVMGGFISINDPDLAESLRQNRFYTGAILDPHSAWLLRRSLHTLPIRMREHVRVTRELAQFLKSRAEVGKVFMPTLDGEQLRDYGGILFFEFKNELKDQYLRFRDALTIFGSGTGMACVTAMVAQPWSGSHSSMSNAEKIEMGITPGLVRLCFGLEAEVDLMADLSRAFESLYA